MKKIFYIPILFLMLSMALGSCDKDPVDVLSKIKTVGHATINGKAYEDNEYWSVFSAPPSEMLYFDDDSIIQYIAFLAPVDSTKKPFYHLTFYLLEGKQPLKNGQTIKINFCKELAGEGIKGSSIEDALKYYTNIRSILLNNHTEGAAIAEMNFLYSQKISLEGELTIEKVSSGYQKVWGKYHLNTPQESESPLTINGDFEAAIQKN
jgi:hypothetical protein